MLRIDNGGLEFVCTHVRYFSYLDYPVINLAIIYIKCKLNNTVIEFYIYHIIVSVGVKKRYGLKSTQVFIVFLQFVERGQFI